MRVFGPACTLGEGPLWHPLRDELFWFDIPSGTLYASDAEGGNLRDWSFGEPASAAGWIDQDTLLVATASALVEFTIATGRWVPKAPLEADNPVTRSNDGRTGPDGSFWIGTMGRELEPRVSAYYRYVNGSVEKLFGEVSIPNATCFSPDGRMAYLADTRKQVIWRWPLDQNGAPIGEREVHINLRDENLNPDGAVCDAEGYLWNAQWGAGRVARYAPDGSFDRAVDLPVSQPTCPAFQGGESTTLFVTSARENLSEEALKREPEAGRMISVDVGLTGIEEHRVRL